MASAGERYRTFLVEFKCKVQGNSRWQDETKHEYEKAIVDYIKEIKNEEKDKIEKNFKKLIEGDGIDLSDDNDEKICYAAYCTLHTYYRRMRNHSKLEELDKKYSEKFKEHLSFAHFKLLLSVDSSPLKVDELKLMEAEESARLMSCHTGAWHLLSDLVARYYEEQEDLSPEFIKKDEWYKKGVRAVNKAIQYENDYAKFYSTRGRLYCLVNEYDKALQDIKKAIDQEDSSNVDYSMRISRYLTLQLKFEAEKELYAMKKKYDSQMKNLEGLLYKNVEILGLFAGIVSFVIAGINIAGAFVEESFYYAAGLILIMFGGLLGTFYGLGIVLKGSMKFTSNKKSNITLNISILVLIIGIITGGMIIGMK